VYNIIKLLSFYNYWYTIILTKLVFKSSKHKHEIRLYLEVSTFVAFLATL